MMTRIKRAAAWTGVVAATVLTGPSAPAVADTGGQAGARRRLPDQRERDPLAGLTVAQQPFQYRYSGKLSGCAYTGANGPTGGTISAGEPTTIAGRRYQEPVPTGTGGCLGTTTAGYDFAHWSDGTQTIVKFTTASAGVGSTHLAGTIVSQLSLASVTPGGKPAIFRSTRFRGQIAFGALTFTASDESLCGQPQGVTAAHITGVLSHVSSH